MLAESLHEGLAMAVENGLQMDQALLEPFEDILALALQQERSAKHLFVETVVDHGQETIDLLVEDAEALFHGAGDAGSEPPLPRR